MPSAAALSQAHAAYRWLAHGLARQQAGLPGGALPAWAHADAVQSLSLVLPDRSGSGCGSGAHHGSGAPCLHIALRDGIAGGALPATLALPGGADRLALRAVRAPRAIGQGAPGICRQGAPRIAGTATCLVQDRLAPARNYLLTCGHVAAPDAQCAVNQALDIDDQGHTRVGRLVDWQPSIGVDVLRTNLDAALVEVAPGDAIALRNIACFLPTGLGSAPTANMAVSLRRRGTPLPGQLMVYWSGFVDLPGLTPGYPDYFLADAIGYRASQPTQAGDSGAALWDSADRLMGMHIGALPDDTQDQANAVYGPIDPVLAWYSVQPWLRGEGAGTVTATPHAPAAAPVGGPVAVPQLGPQGNPAAHELAVLAATLWGEARNQGDEGMRAVACVIQNRKNAGYRKKTTFTAVCLDPKQFSCWNAGDPNLPRMKQVASQPDAAYQTALAIAAELIQRGLPDITDRSRHYYAATLRPPAYWARGKSPRKVIGDHLFFNDID